MSAKNVKVLQELNLGHSIQDKHPYSTVLDSDDALALILELEDLCNSSRDFMIISMACYFFELEQAEKEFYSKEYMMLRNNFFYVPKLYDVNTLNYQLVQGFHYKDVPQKLVNKAAKWYDNVFVPNIVKYMQEHDREHVDEITDEHNWMFYLEWYSSFIGAVDAIQFNAFARNNYGEAIKGSMQAKRYSNQQAPEAEGEADTKND